MHTDLWKAATKSDFPLVIDVQNSKSETVEKTHITFPASKTMCSLIQCSLFPNPDA